MAAVAALPMYDLPELRSAHDELWRAFRRHLDDLGFPDAPDELDRTREPLEIWAHPDLLIAQTCGFPFITMLQEKVRLVATPVYEAAGCEGPFYRSWIVVPEQADAERFEQLEGTVVAINSTESHSGCNVLRAMAAPLARNGRFFARVHATGSHGASLEAVRHGHAACAAIDCVSWALLDRHRPQALRGLRILEGSPPAPSLPYITSAERSDREVAGLRAALRRTLDDETLKDERARLLLTDIAVLEFAEYEPIAQMWQKAHHCGYRQLD